MTLPDDVMPPGRVVALYLHVPFCRARCAYCDFNTYAGLDDLIAPYVRALAREIAHAGARRGRLSVPTIYLGGGTPSLLSLDALSDIVRGIRAAFDLAAEPEVTLEANPGTVTLAYLRGLREIGVNRLSLGAQSAHDDELQLLGRIHTWAEAVEAVSWARAAGFDNLNLDLIFGLPGQSVARWRRTLEAALALAPEHLSLYGLSVEAGTPLAERIASGALPEPDEDRAAAMYELAEDALAEAGFFHYEISNWARADVGSRWWPDADAETSEAVSPYVCRHNLTYWRNEPWLGFGAGAHSWLGPDGPGLSEGRRWANPAHPRAYVASWRETTPSRTGEAIDRQLAMGETMMLGLRLAAGVRSERFERRFGASLEEAFGEALEELTRRGLLSWDGAVARLTRRGRLLGNRVFARFL